MYLGAKIVHLERTEIVLVRGVISFTEIITTEELLVDPENGTPKVNNAEEFTIGGYLPCCPITRTIKEKLDISLYPYNVIGM